MCQWLVLLLHPEPVEFPADNEHVVDAYSQDQEWHDLPDDEGRVQAEE
jgi:hypothetical protein